jgi:DNA polymerase-3 subunit alpha
MPHADFVHLRVHTAYSLSEGAIRCKSLATLCREQRMPAVAITDANNLFGAMEFSETCATAGVQPIIGCQLGVAVGATQTTRPVAPGHQRTACESIVLLVQNQAGYCNLLKLVSRAYLETEAGDEPHVPLAALAERSEGLIALTGGPLGPVGRRLAEGQTEEAERILRQLAAYFPNRLYVEIQRHHLEIEDRTEPGFLDLAYRHDLPLVATNEAFFTTEEMYEAHDALLCIAQGTVVSETERRRVSRHHRLKSATEMRELFADLPEAADNTLTVARRCAFMVEKVKPILPPFDCGAGRTEAEELKAQAREGLERRLKQVLPADHTAWGQEDAARPYWERLEYELDVIVKMGFAGYFLIVADFIKWAKVQDIPVGPGRGSGAGSVVAWALTITDLDPLRWGLLFERFLNPERVSMPDFDVDFCQDRRDEVIRYVQEKYGHDRVAQIITFGKLQARAALRDVGRVLGMPYGQVDRICKLVPNNPASPVSLADAIKGEPQLQQMADTDEAVARLFSIALKLEGLYRNASTHAAGVVIGDRPLDELVALYRDPRSTMPVTQFNMKYVESAGLVKYDFLGLKTLTVIAEAVKLLRARGVDLDVSTLPLDDRPTYEMLGRGETSGVFQLESAGMRDVLRSLRPDTFADIIAVVALYRPGPMDNIPKYIKCKHGEDQPDYLYPTLEGILKETFGIMIYQEQVMQIAQELSGYTLGGADLLRRAMGKKIKEEMDKQRQTFVDGAVARGVDPRKASDIFDQVAKFAGYGFNKSHAAAYALVAYQTAYLKANHPVEFMAATMTHDMGNTDKLNAYRQELARLGVRLLPPDVNASGVAFSVERMADGSAAIRYALAAVKNVGATAMAALVAERDEGGRRAFKDLGDFFRRVDIKALNKRQMENLVRAGAFDGLHRNRRQLFEGLESLMKHAVATQAERASDQMGLFGGGGEAAPPLPRLSEVADWSPMERLKEEFEAIGFYLSAHPLDAYGRSLARIEAKRFSEVLAAGQSGPVKLAGTVIGKKERTSAKGTRFAFIQLSDTTGVFEVMVFSELLAAAREVLEIGNSLFIKANAQFEGETVRLTANSIERLDAVTARAAAGLQVVVDSPAPLPALQKVLAGEGRGKGTIKIVSRIDPTTEVVIALRERYAVSAGLLQAVKSVPGVVAVTEI